MFGSSKIKIGAAVFILTLLIIGGLLTYAVCLLRQTDAGGDLSSNPNVKILRTADNTVEEAPLEEIVIGVLAGEMPADFAEEALMAQAVAARTYILKRLPKPYGSGMAVHNGGAYICDDFAHCQAYVDEAQRKKNWGADFAAKEKKIRRAVEATAGKVLTYQGELISPTFCSTCGGHTEAAGDYWQSDVPALQAVPCYWDSGAPKYLSAVYYSNAQMAAKLGVTEQELPSLKIADFSASGRVTLVTCGKKQWKGSAIRTALGLNSTDFSWLADDSGYLISVKGFGHGVGLCQHGANGMAQAGADFEKILHHYYTDVDIVAVSDLK